MAVLGRRKCDINWSCLRSITECSLAHSGLTGAPLHSDVLACVSTPAFVSAALQSCTYLTLDSSLTRVSWRSQSSVVDCACPYFLFGYSAAAATSTSLVEGHTPLLSTCFLANLPLLHMLVTVVCRAPTLWVLPQLLAMSRQPSCRAPLQTQ